MGNLYLASINSGSNGNCYYIGNDKEAVLIDAGLSCRETEKRMQRMGLELKKVKALFISHEHRDHIKGLEILSRKHRLPVYISVPTLNRSGLKLEQQLVRPLFAGVSVAIGSLTINPFNKYHDAADPYSFTVEQENTCIGIFTDIGRVCKNLSMHFRKCHAAFLEANYDELMLENGRYPYHLKKRIRGGHGHLSNKEALDLFISCRPTQMSHLFLSHLSANNNDPEVALHLFQQQAKNANIVVASRYRETAVYAVSGNPTIPSAMAAAYEQLALF